MWCVASHRSHKPKYYGASCCVVSTQLTAWHFCPCSIVVVMANLRLCRRAWVSLAVFVCMCVCVEFLWMSKFHFDQIRQCGELPATSSNFLRISNCACWLTSCQHIFVYTTDTAASSVKSMNRRKYLEAIYLAIWHFHLVYLWAAMFIRWLYIRWNLPPKNHTKKVSLGGWELCRFEVVFIRTTTVHKIETFYVIIVKFS